MELFDTHAHYDDEAFDADRDAVLSALPEAGVSLVLDPGCDLLSSQKAAALAETYPHVYAAVGVHPEHCAGFGEAALSALRQLAARPKVIAIGEIGLDYYWEQNPPREIQRQAFRAQLALALELDLPVIVHDREAHGDTLDILREFPAVRGVLHCFSGSPEMARALAERGWYFGFDGPVTYKNARKSLEAAAAVPRDRLLLETDSPYLSPVPLRGRRNDSRSLPYIVQRLAEVLDMEPEALAKLCLENGKRLFGLK